MPAERAITPSSSSSSQHQHHEKQNDDYMQRRRRLRRGRNNPFETLDNSKCAKCLTKLVCKSHVSCGIVGGDTYLLYGYSRLVLMEEIGAILTSIALAIYGVCVSLLLAPIFDVC